MTAELQLDRPIVLVGMMGAGKSAIGRRLAERLGVPFLDADAEIEKAADMTVADIFDSYGEAEFRRLEREVIKRLLRQGPCVLATGGGAWMDPDTRRAVHEIGVSVWLKAGFDLIWERVSRKSHRPLLRTEDPRGTLAALMQARDPIYAQASVTVESTDAPKESMVERVLADLARALARPDPARSAR